MAQVNTITDLDASQASGPETALPRGEKVSLIGVNKLFDSPGGGTVTALDTVTMGINEGEFFTLLGPSGCGKTTLLRLLAGFEVPTSGEVRLDGEVVNDLPAEKRRVNTVFQNYALFPHLTVAKNISFSLEMLGTDKAETASRVAQMLELVRLEGVGQRYPWQLSGGQQQRIALARALASRPSLLLLDEPLSALDLRLRRDMQSELKRIQNGTGTTFVYVTHDQEEALAMSDRIAVMNDGRIHQVGTPKEIYEEPADLTVCKFIGDINLTRVSLQSRNEDTASVSLPNGKTISAKAAPFHNGGAALQFAFRPEDVELTAQGAGLFDAEVTECTYVGSQTVVRLVSEFGDAIVANHRDHLTDHEVTPGCMTGVRIPAEKSRVLEE